MILLTRSARMLAILGAALLLVSSGTAQAQNLFAINGTLSLNSSNTTTRLIGPRLGQASATGLGKAAISIPANLFTSAGAAFKVFPSYPGVAQFIDTFTTTHPVINVAPSAGPGSFAFCPPVGNAVNPGCTNPAQATGGFNGLIQYTGGINQFGGTMQLIRDQTGMVSRLLGTAPLQFHHTPRSTITTWPPGWTMSNSRVAPGVAGVITQSPVLGPSGSIQSPGIYIGPGPTPPSGFETGQPLTTGTIVLKDSLPSATSFTLSGYDNRNAAGHGTIQLVGGSFIQKLSLPVITFPRQTTLTLQVPEPSITFALGFGALALIGLRRISRGDLRS